MFYLIPWKDDHWLSEQGTILRYDKLEHLILAFIGLYVTLLLFASSMFMVLLCVIVWEFIGVGWEIYQAYFSHGFSMKDFIADNIGFMLAAVLFLS